MASGLGSGIRIRDLKNKSWVLHDMDKLKHT